MKPLTPKVCVKILDKHSLWYFVFKDIFILRKIRLKTEKNKKRHLNGIRIHKIYNSKDLNVKYKVNKVTIVVSVDTINGRIIELKSNYKKDNIPLNFKKGICQLLLSNYVLKREEVCILSIIYNNKEIKKRKYCYKVNIENLQSFIEVLALLWLFTNL